MSRYLEHGLPDEGKVVVGHPDDANMARVVAVDKGLPWTLSSYVPPGSCYVLDMDLFERRPNGTLRLKEHSSAVESAQEQEGPR